MYSEQVTKLLEGKHRARSFVGVVTVVKDFDPEGSYCVMVTVRRRDGTAPSEATPMQSHIPNAIISPNSDVLWAYSIH